MEITRFVESGHKRKGYIKQCEHCGKDFPCRINGKNKYCSAVCSGIGAAKRHEKNRVEVVCATCDKKFTKAQSKISNSKSGLFFCCRKCKDEAQKLGGITEIMPPHYGTGTPSYRDKFTEEELVCARCGYDEFKCCVDIHHIDRDRENNDKENLIPLCSNCHMAHHRSKITKEEILEWKKF